MIFSSIKFNSLKGARLTFLFFLAVFGWIPGLAQGGQSGEQEAFIRIYKSVREAQKHDPLIQNGVFYSYPYYNALGHPFLDTKEFETGSVDFRGKRYEDLSLNYDLFNQQLILSWEYDGILQMSLLEPQFLSGFDLKGKRFEKVEFQVGVVDFFQVVSAYPGVSCYYSWYKERREVHDSGNRSTYSFSAQKSRRYLQLDGKFTRYKSNKSFIRVFPEAVRNQLKTYLQKNRVQVMESSERDMEELIRYCDRVLDQLTREGVE